MLRSLTLGDNNDPITKRTVGGVKKMNVETFDLITIVFL